jgi:hypothetical protein
VSCPEAKDESYDDDCDPKESVDQRLLGIVRNSQR